MEKGYYKKVAKTIHHDAVMGVQEQSHFEVVKEYPNGGADVRKIIDVAGIEPKGEYDEVVYEEVWVDYTPKELAQFRIKELKKLLQDSEHRVIEYIESQCNDKEFAKLKRQRQSYRDEIRKLEEEYDLKTSEE